MLARVPFTRHAPSGWAGIVKDPDGDGSMQINRGLRQARELLLQINRLGLPVACEFADTITPQFFADLLSWSCVSAGSETLRELVSGLSMPAGLRAHVDATSPERMAAVGASLADAAGPQVGGAHLGVSSHTCTAHAIPAHAMSVVCHSPLTHPPPRATDQVFFGVTSHGIAGIVQSKGNDECALVMHGGAGTPDERTSRVVGACKELRKAAPAAPAAPPVIVECGGAEVTPDEQAQLVAKLAEALGAGEVQLHGLSLSSHLLSGSQAADAPNRVRGLSITEPCLDWAATSEAVHAVAAAVRRRNAATGGIAAKKPRRG